MAGGLQTARPNADRPTERTPQPAGRPVRPAKLGEIMPDDPSDGAPWVRQAPLTPLIADPGWIHSFRLLVGQLFDAGRDATRYGSLPAYRDTVLKLRWRPFLDGLQAHVRRAVEAGNSVPMALALEAHPGVFHAYQLACVALDDHADPAGPTAAMMEALEGIAALLAEWKPTAPANPAAPANRQARGVPRGGLDERAVAMLIGNPTLANAQLAAALGCREKTLRDSKKCPKLAAARASIRDQREAFRGGSTWRDRRPDDDEV